MMFVRGKEKQSRSNRRSRCVQWRGMSRCRQSRRRNRRSGLEGGKREVVTYNYPTCPHSIIISVGTLHDHGLIMNRRESRFSCQRSSGSPACHESAVSGSCLCCTWTASRVVTKALTAVCQTRCAWEWLRTRGGKLHPWMLRRSWHLHSRGCCLHWDCRAGVPAYQEQYQCRADLLKGCRCSVEEQLNLALSAAISLLEGLPRE